MNVELRETARAAAGWSRPDSPRNGEIEVLRAVAILTVLVQHLPFNLMFWPSRFSGPIFFSGTWAGVDLFFAISGFVIARGLLPQLHGVRDARAFLDVAIPFWIRRAWRLWPSAWFWLAAPLVLCLVFNASGAYGTFKANWWMAVAGFTNLANFYIAQHAYQHVNHGTAFAQWSLSLEEQFYFVLPFAAVLLRRQLATFMGFLFILAFFLPITPIFLNTRSGAFAAGGLLAIASRHPAYADCAPVFLAQHRIARICVLLGGIAALVSLGDTHWRIVSFFPGAINITCGLLVWVASYDAGLLWRAGWPRRVMEAIAARSYSIYLVHIPVFFGMHEAWYRLHHLVNPTHIQALAYFAIAAICVAAVAELNHRLLEMPLREHGKQVARRYKQRLREAAV